jgi:hypothetical protein
MFNPLVGELSHFKDNELDDKILDLSKKLQFAIRIGKVDLLTQLNTLLIMYKEERTRRSLTRKTQLDGDLDQLINVD